MNNKITILGMFAVDLTFVAKRLPEIGETIMSENFYLGPGGKGSNQAVASSRLGADVCFLTYIGNDHFGNIGINLWKEEKINAHYIIKDTPTGAAFIYLDKENNNNAIIVNNGAAKEISPDFIKNQAKNISSSSVFMTQLEHPLDAAVEGLKIAKKNNVCTILNPAPAIKLSKEVLGLCDFITPNETEAEVITGIKINCSDSATEAIFKLQSFGCSNVIITLGEKGAILGEKNRKITMVSGSNIENVLDTSGAGDCFNGALAYCISNNKNPVDSVKFACKAAGISVTRKGTSMSMPKINEILKLKTWN